MINGANGNENLYEQQENAKVGSMKQGGIEKDKMKLSIFCDHLFEAMDQTGESLEELLETAHRAGISGVEMEFETLEEYPELNRIIHDAGMEISNLYQCFEFDKEYEEGVNAGRKMVDLAQKMCIERLMIIPGILTEQMGYQLNRCSASYEDTAAFMAKLPEIQSMKEALAKITEYAMERGIEVTLEDFDHPTSPIARMNQVKWFIDQVPGLKHTLDMGNYAFSNEDVREAYNLLGDFVCHVHCKDLGEEQEEEAAIRKELGLLPDEKITCRKGLRPVPVGEGYIPIAGLVKKLHDNGYRGYFAIEHFNAPDQKGYMLRSAAFLKSILEGAE